MGNVLRKLPISAALAVVLWASMAGAMALAASDAGGPAWRADTEDRSAPHASLKGRSIRINERGVTRLRVACAAAEREHCVGAVVLHARPPQRAGDRRSTSAIRLGGRRFDVAPGRTATLRLRVKRTGTRLVQRLRRLNGSATLTAHDRAGNSLTRRTAVVLLAAQR